METKAGNCQKEGIELDLIIEMLCADNGQKSDLDLFNQIIYKGNSDSEPLKCSQDYNEEAPNLESTNVKFDREMCHWPECGQKFLQSDTEECNNDVLEGSNVSKSLDACYSDSSFEGFSEGFTKELEWQTSTKKLLASEKNRDNKKISEIVGRKKIIKICDEICHGEDHIPRKNAKRKASEENRDDKKVTEIVEPKKIRKICYEDGDVEEPITRKMVKKKKTFACDLCKSMFSRSDNLKRHKLQYCKGR